VLFIKTLGGNEMRKRASIKFFSLYTALGLPFVLTHFAFAADISSVDSFIQSLIQVLAGLAGLIATGFFVIGGFTYITSSGNPEHLDKAKRTLFYSGLGLVITIGAVVISSIVTTLATNAFGK